MSTLKIFENTHSQVYALMHQLYVCMYKYSYIHIAITSYQLLTYFYNLGFAATCFEVEKTMHSIGLYRIIFLCATGISALLSLAITVKVNLIILCAMLLMFAPLNLMISCCSNPRPYIFVTWHEKTGLMGTKHNCSQNTTYLLYGKRYLKSISCIMLPTHWCTSSKSFYEDTMFM